VYAFCVEVAASASGNKGGSEYGTEYGTEYCTEYCTEYNTVSHFNAIHFSCHDAARRADAALKAPKGEWEGASLRNGATLANNLLPLLAGSRCSVSRDAATAADASWWDRLGEINGKGGSPVPRELRLRIVLEDIAALLGRFAVGADFAAGARGGGRRSNARLVPALLSLAARELLREPGGSEPPGDGSNGADAVSRTVEWNARNRASEAWGVLQELSASRVKKNAADADSKGSEGSILSPGSAEAFPSALVLSLLVTSNEAWRASRRDACAAAVAYAALRGVRAVGGADPSVEPSPESPSETFEAAKPALLMLGLVDKLHAALQKSRRRGLETSRGLAAGSGAYSSEAASVCVSVSLALRDFGGVEADETFEEWLDEADDAEDATAFFDVMECLGDVMDASDVTADAFVARAFHGAREARGFASGERNA
jgi:E3 ubiquitin-protein ligase UBR4